MKDDDCDVGSRLMQQTPPREQYLLSSVSSHNSEKRGATQVPGQSSIDSVVVATGASVTEEEE